MFLVTDKKYNPAIDLLRVLSIFSVVLIHTTTKMLEFENYDLPSHPLLIFFNQATRFAVPLFFLISAFVLELNYPVNFSYQSYFKKRLQRLLPPYIFWSLIYYFIIYPHNTKSFLIAFLSGDASYQLYFVPTLFLFYLFFPFLHLHLNFFRRKIVLLALFFFQICLLSLDYYFHPLPLPYPLSVFLLNFSLFIVGMLAVSCQSFLLLFVKKYFLPLCFSALLLAFVITREGETFYLQTKNYLSFYSQWRPSILIYSLVIGSFFYHLFSRLKLNHNLVKKLASYSFFVYFVHVIFLELSWSLLPHPYIFITVPLLSYLSAFIISKIPYLSQITG